MSIITIELEEEGKTIEAEEVAEATMEPEFELDAIDEAITKVIAEAKSVINKTVKAFGAGSSLAPEK